MADPTPSRNQDDRPRTAFAGAGQVLSQLKALWIKQSRGRRAIALAAVVAVIGIVGWTRLAGSSGTKWLEVIPGSTADDASELSSLLGTRAIAYRMHGNAIEVAAGDLDQARAVAASAGLPHSGAGFELFDHTSLGQSAFAEQVNYRRALQGELARSITSMAQVDSARVHIAMGRRSVFKDGDEPPSASVALRLHPGQQLTKEQVQGVRQMIAASVDGLVPDAVVVVDERGTPLDGSTDTPDDQRSEIEHAVAARVRGMLETAVGRGHVAVVANADIDTSKVNETQELYDGDKEALRSESRTVDGPDATSTTGGIAGVRGNLPGTAAATGTTPVNGHLQETRNYEVSKTVRQTLMPDARLRKLHVAVLIDHATGPDGKSIPRTDAELAELSALAREAAGLDDARGDKIEIRSIPFVTEADPVSPTASDEPVEGGLPVPMWVIAAGGGALLLLLATTFFVVRAKRRRRRNHASPVLALPATLSEIERVLDAPDGARLLSRDAENAALPPGPPAHGRVFASVRADASRAANILSSWLAETPASKGARA